MSEESEIKEYKAKFLELYHLQETDKIAQMAFDVFEKERNNEEILAMVAGIVHEWKIIDALKLVPEFIDRFPNSVEIIEPYYAEICYMQSWYDSATLHSRRYLRRAKDKGIFEILEGTKVLKQGVGLSFFYLTSAYRFAGALSHCIKIFQLGLKYPVGEKIRTIYQEEIEKLEKDLKVTTDKEIDIKWETFFRAGQYVDELYKHCQSKKLPILADRVDLIEGFFRTGTQHRLAGENEIFFLEAYSKDGEKFEPAPYGTGNFRMLI